MRSSAAYLPVAPVGGSSKWFTDSDILKVETLAVWRTYVPEEDYPVTETAEVVVVAEDPEIQQDEELGWISGSREYSRH